MVVKLIDDTFRPRIQLEMRLFPGNAGLQVGLHVETHKELMQTC